MGRKRTVEESFERWWAKNGAKHYSELTIEIARDYARAAWHNGYNLGRRREKAKRHGS